MQQYLTTATYAKELEIIERKAHDVRTDFSNGLQFRRAIVNKYNHKYKKKTSHTLLAKFTSL